MKILVVHNAYQSNLLGGEDAVFKREYKALKASLGPENVFSYMVSNDDLKIWKLPFSIWANLYHGAKVKKLIEQHNIDLVHVHNFFPMLTSSIFVAAKQAGAKVIHTLHNYRWWCLSGTLFYNNTVCTRCLHKRFALPGVARGCYRDSKPQSLLAAMAFAFYKRKKVIHAIDAFLVLSEHQRAIVSQVLPAKKVFLKHNAVDQASVGHAKREGFVFIGRLEQGKGIEPLLKAWQKLKQPQRLTIIGAGPLEANLKKQYAQSNIEFLGSQPFEVAAKYLNSAKFCIHPSLYYETFGLVIFEAMIRGTPVIGFDIGTRSEFIEHGVNGLLSNPDNLDKTIESIAQYDYTKMSQAAKAFAQAFEVNTIIEQQVNTYKNVLELA